MTSTDVALGAHAVSVEAAIRADGARRAGPAEATDLIALPTGQEPAGERRKLGIPRGVERLLGVVLVLVAWALATNLGWISTKTLPKPGTVAVVAVDLWTDGTLQSALWASIQRVAWGLGIGVPIGTALALVVGLSRLGDDLIDTNISAFRFVPIIALQPLLVVWLGVGETVKVTMIVLGVAFPIYINTTTAIKSLHPGYRELADVVGLTKGQLIRKVVLPGALPGFLVGLRMAVAISWLLLVFAETINATSGLGKVMSDASLFGKTDVLILGLIIYAVLGLTTDAGVRFLERRLLAWQPGR
ncbi:MAG TPA: ABC transporter permease [Acidimicrobiales bacterium]|nr:ABC transporter permease [Acidimicrobiales bacterium]